MENVPSLQSKFKGRLFGQLLEMSEALNYDVHFSVLNSVQYGVPQRRKRLFVVGTERGIAFSFPTPTHKDSLTTHNPDLFDDTNHSLSEFRTVRDALSDLPIISDGCRHGLLPYNSGPTSSYQEEIRGQLTGW